MGFRTYCKHLSLLLGNTRLAFWTHLSPFIFALAQAHIEHGATSTSQDSLVVSTIWCPALYVDSICRVSAPQLTLHIWCPICGLLNQDDKILNNFYAIFLAYFCEYSFSPVLENTIADSCLSYHPVLTFNWCKACLPQADGEPVSQQLSKRVNGG